MVGRVTNCVEPKLSFIVGRPGSDRTTYARLWAKSQGKLIENHNGETDRILYLAGLGREGPELAPPFRAPHHTISQRGMYGQVLRGWDWRPGEVSLASGGVLFLDDAPEFHQTIWTMLWSIWHIKHVTGNGCPYPSRFHLLVASSPCPCGQVGRPTMETACNCTPEMIVRYMGRIPAWVREAENTHWREDQAVWNYVSKT